MIKKIIIICILLIKIQNFYFFPETNKPIIVNAEPIAPISVSCSCKKMNANTIVITGIRKSPVVIFTVPRIVHALFQAIKQTALAKIPKKPNNNQLKMEEKRATFNDLESST